MKLLIPVIYVLFAAQQPPIFEVRRLYTSCAIQKDSLVKLSELLKAAKPDDQPVLYCYSGAVQIIMAKYATNPFTKFADFKKGKLMMEEAIAKDTASFEMRYLRLSIQSNLPSFLSYHDQISADQYFLKTNIDSHADKQLREMANTLLNTNKEQN
jgi:hypothetical protein